MSGFESEGTGEADLPVHINHCSSLGNVIIFLYFPEKNPLIKRLYQSAFIEFDRSEIQC